MTIGPDPPSLSVAGVSERDIDLLLLEEFVSSPGFAKWFSGQIGLDEKSDLRMISARRSVTQSTGESDLEVVLAGPEGVAIRLLVENKITAAFQPRQAARYQERGRTYREREDCTDYKTVLVAPARYLGDDSSSHGFDACVSYEAVLSWFATSRGLGERGWYKQSLVRSAIDKAVHGYQLVEDAPVTDFWRSYWLLSLRVAPALEMPEPIGKPSRAGFIYFRPGTLPRGVSIVHKLPHGHLDLQFAHRAGDLARLRAEVVDALRPGMTIERAGRSAVIRQKVPVLNTGRAFQDQEPDVRSGLELALQLLEWYTSLKTAPL